MEGEAARMADKDVKIRINTEANTKGAKEAEQSLEKVGTAAQEVANEVGKIDQSSVKIIDAAVVEDQAEKLHNLAEAERELAEARKLRTEGTTSGLATDILGPDFEEQTAKAKQSIVSLEEEVKRLRQELRNATIGSKEFEDLNGQLRSTEKQLKAVTGASRQADTGQVNLAKSTNTAAGSFKEIGRHVQNTSYQVQDFVVQVQGGTDAARAFAQQAPQLFTGFGPGGAVLGLLLAFAPAIASMFGKVRDELRETAKAEEEHKAEVEDLAKAYDFLAKSFDVLVNNSAKRVANLEKEQQLAERAEKAETERAKRQAQNDWGKEIAEERIRLATVEAQLSTSSGEAAVRLAKEREEILKRIAAKEKEIAETLRKKDEESAEKRVTDAQKVVDLAKDDSKYGDQNFVDAAKAMHANAETIQAEIKKREDLVAAYDAEIEARKQAIRDLSGNFKGGIVEQGIEENRLKKEIEDLEKTRQEANKPSQAQTTAEANTKQLKETFNSAGDAALKLADQLKEALDKLQQATIDRDQLKQNNVQARGKEIDDQEVEAKRKLESGTQKAADDLSQKVEGMIEQITAAIPDAKSNPAVQALVERLRQIEQGGTQEGELNEAEGLIQQLAGQVQGAQDERRAFLTQVGTTFQGVRSLFSELLTTYQQQWSVIDEMRRDLNNVKQQQGNLNH